MTAIMPIDEPRPRGTVLGERTDRRVCEAEHYFRCKICGGYLDARDLVWVEDHEGPCRTRRKMEFSSANRAARQMETGASRTDRLRNENIS
jgi:hypothetical protein